MKFLTNLCLLLALFTLVVNANAANDDRADPILRTADLPGFFLHMSYVESRPVKPEFAVLYPRTKEFLDFEELWMTVPKATLNRASRPRLLSKQTILVYRWVFATSEEAARYAEQVYSLSQKRNKAKPTQWLIGSPSGKVVGDKSWYAIHEGASQPDEALRARRINQESLKMVVLVKKTVITFDASGTDDRPIDRNWAETIVRTIAARVKPEA